LKSVHNDINVNEGQGTCDTNDYFITVKIVPILDRYIEGNTRKENCAKGFVKPNGVYIRKKGNKYITKI